MKHDIVGHDRIVTQLKRSIECRSLHSSLLFSGAEGVGKKLVARKLAQTLLCLAPQAPFGGCGCCNSCTVFVSGNHPDFLEVSTVDKDQWKVERIREHLSGFQLKPYLQHGRVVIFDDAHALSIAA